ncbi:MAG: VOC family protein [Chloroflexi bacterium]|nr:VOC family protein [Chloroflexota bacterium]
MKFRGVNHLAMVTNDMEKTVRFYRDILGMPLVAAIGNTPQLPYRHYFFEAGPNSTIAFFEWPGMVEEFHKPAGQPATGRIQFDHVSFDVESEDALLELQGMLAKAGVEVTHIVDHRFIHSIYFTDPNGIALEASVWITNPTGLPEGVTDHSLLQDRIPVPALQEQLDQARLVETT